MVQIGCKGEIEKVVSAEMTARHMGSGELPVFATPAMIALVEETAWKSVAGELAEGEGTVGTRVDIRHLAASPVGAKVTCKTTLVEIVRKRLVFSVEVFDEFGKIGEGVHERFVVSNERFMKKVEEKL